MSAGSKFSKQRHGEGACVVNRAKEETMRPGAPITWRKLLHWGPLTALGIIKSVTFMMVHCCSMWWPPADSIGGFLNTFVFLALSGLTVYNFMNAIFEGPGYLPFNWKPENPDAEQYLQFCGSCEGFKAPRAHHCRKCGRCVMKMDHHCPWINNCVGYLNHGHFAAFLFFAVCGCLQATVCLSCSLYRALNRMWYIYYGNGTEPLVYLGLSMLVFCVFCLGLSIGVVLAVGMLLYFQVRAIVRNQTGIEDWIIEKAKHRRRMTEENFVFPYNLGWKTNLKQVINMSLSPEGNGISWPVTDGCNQYTLTVEQQEQKAEKRHRTRSYLARERYSGSWVPVTKGFRVVFNLPLTDEPRLALSEGDTVLVTRWRGHWLFGEKIHVNGSKGRRGWFPKRCAVPLVEGVPVSPSRHAKDQ